MSAKVVNAVQEREAAKRRRLAALVEVAQPKKAKRMKKAKPVEVIAEPEPIEPEPAEGPEVIDAYDDRPAEDVAAEDAADPVEETVAE